MGGRLNHEGHEGFTKATKVFSFSSCVRKGPQVHEVANALEGHEVHPDTPV